MKKRFFSALLALFLALSLSLSALASGSAAVSVGSLANFKIQKTFSSGQFIDVADYAWYAMYVQAGYEFGIVSGKSPDAFYPDDKMTIAEAIKTAVSLSSIYYTGKAEFASSSVWYQPYVEYALKNGIIETPLSDYNTYITREAYIDMIAKALPAEAFPAVNSVADNEIPDVALSDSFGSSVYTLYRAGVLTGCDAFGTFHPDFYLSRAEASAIITRSSDAAFRKSIVLPRELDAEEIFQKCSSAVFYVERYDSEGVLLGIGSGFFISRDGLALTNYHVISGASSAIITTSTGVKYTVKGICGYDKATDLAILQIDGSGFNYLSIGDSSTLTTGANVFAIGSPFGLINTISDGLIANTSREVNGTDFIQYTAPISMGSGGGPVINTLGQAVGVTCLTVTNGQTLNFAVPINKMDALSRTGCVSLISIVAANSGSIIYYRGYYPVPDYGVYVGTLPYKSQLDAATSVKSFFYKLSDITVPDSKAVDGYIDQLKQNGFTWQSSYTNDEGNVDVYYNANTDLSVHFGMDNIDGVLCRFVALH
jgi:S1-C subfamily serine protease